MELKKPARIFWAALVVAWLFDFLFWHKSPGISFPIFIAVCIAAGLLLSWGEGLRPGWRSLVLIVPALFFASVVFLRREPFTLFVAFLYTLVSLALLASAFLGGRWIRYSLTDLVVEFFKLAGSGFILPLETWMRRRKARQAGQTTPPEGEPVPTPAPSARSQTGSVLRGVALAVPVVGVLTALLASADPIFGRGVESFFNLFHIENLGEYVFRGVYILVLAYVLCGIFLHAFIASRNERLIGLDRPWLRPFLGWTETAIVLGSVDLLFAAFVAIQARYFFGGQANISVSGFTYAEYARRGFSELVAVAVISLVLVIGASSSAKRETKPQQRGFQALVALLVGLVIVILVSAYQRLTLYEGAYGFSRLRTYTHVFIPWLGLLLIGVAGLEIAQRPRWFAAAGLAAVLGFGVTLSTLNVDAFIARQNLARASAGADLDFSYLVTLSDDAVPALVGRYLDPGSPADLRQQTGGILACRAALAGDREEDASWQAYTQSGALAGQLMAANAASLGEYDAQMTYDGWAITMEGKSRPCIEPYTMD